MFDSVYVYSVYQTNILCYHNIRFISIALLFVSLYVKHANL